jgi:tRNA1(Val) A37 N6-methylase TrmN6
MEDLAVFDQLDDLQMGGWRLWQNSRFFRFGTDGLLLAEFARCRKKEKVIDLCSGTGIVPFWMMAKGQIDSADALELQPYLCRLMERSAEENACADRLKVIEGDLCNIRALLPGGSYDVVTVNPPYEPVGRGVLGQIPIGNWREERSPARWRMSLPPPLICSSPMAGWCWWADLFACRSR